MISAFCLTLRSTQQQQTAAFKMEQLEIESVPKIPAIISKILYYITLSSSKIIVLNVWHDNSDEIWLWCCLSIPDNWVGVGECLAWAGPGSNLDTQLALPPPPGAGPDVVTRAGDHQMTGPPGSDIMRPQLRR